MKRLFYILFFCTFLWSCSEDTGLDTTDLDELTEEVVFSDVTYTRRALAHLYANMREVTDKNSGSFSRLFNMNTTVAMLDNATDDGAGNTTRGGGTVDGIQRYISGRINATSAPLDGTHPWRFYYNAIRAANIFLANIDNSPLEVSEREVSKYQARFLRAYYYHELFKWFGPLVITTEPLDPFAFTTTKREDIKTTVDFIVSEFDMLSRPGLLPDKWSGGDYGRITRSAAYAYKARTILYAASPLFSESGYTYSQAAQAAKETIEYCEGSGANGLYVDPDDPDKSYSRLFNERVNPENILVYLRSPSNDLYNMFPSFNPWNVNKELSTAPTQWLVDSYDMLNGKEPILGYNADYTPIINPESGYNEQNPYANRDPRFKLTLLHHGMVWPAVNSATATVDLRTPNSWGSGYFLTKYLDDRIDHRRSGTTSMNFIMMRYAEVLLNYAEAVNESSNDISARTIAIEQLNRIRRRAGFAEENLLKVGDYDQNSLRQRIRKERRVELCFEDHRFFDIRRWMIASEVMNRPAIGIVIENGLFTRKRLDQRSYSDRMNLSPLPVSEVNNLPLVYQNPGY